MSTKKIDPEVEAKDSEKSPTTETPEKQEPEQEKKPTMESVPPPVDPLEEYVDIELFYDGDKYKDDVFVSVNGENCLIKRGVPVKIKRKFVHALEMSDKQDRYTRSIISSFENEYRDAARSLT